MTSLTKNLRRDLKIVNELGLHARAAAQLAKLAQKAAGPVWIQFGSEQVDAKQVIDILTLAAGRGDQVHIAIENDGDLDILNQIVALIGGGFGE
jgi:phosphocarrier protein HPr